MKIPKFLPAKKRRLKVIVTSNCQVASICACLSIILSDKFEVIPLPLKGDNNLNLNESINLIKKADFWVTLNDFINFYEISLNVNSQIIKIPRIRFNAFHPDIVYIKDKKTNLHLNDYHSFIAIWSFINGLDENKTKSLFSATIFDKLNYFSMWEPSKHILKKSFENSDINFNIFFQEIQKECVFMHTINHPKISAIIVLASMIRDKIEPNNHFIYDGEINDPLNTSIWPVYPEIGEFYSFGQSGYVWKCSNGKKLYDLDSYIKFCFEGYRKTIKNVNEIEIIRSNFVEQNLILKEFI